MLKSLLRYLTSHFLDNILTYSACFCITIVGIVSGFLSGIGFTDIEFFEIFFNNLKTFSTENLLVQAIFHSVILSGIIVVFGMSPFGMIIVPFTVLFKAFSLGYTIGAVSSVYGIKSIIFVVLALIPPFVIWYPSLIYASVNGIKISILLYRTYIKKQPSGITGNISNLFLSGIFVFVCVMASKLLEIYIVPKILNIVCGIYI